MISHGMAPLRKRNQNTDSSNKCDYDGSRPCPLEGKCVVSSVVYGAEFKEDNRNNLDGRKGRELDKLKQGNRAL